MKKDNPTVFIIDDDPSARRGLMRLVRATGFSAETFSSAKEFLDGEQRRDPGCIVLDVRMPSITGPELQHQLNRLEYHMPIIFISAHGDIRLATDTMKNGAMDFLTKPVDAELLLEAIRNALQQDRNQRGVIVERSELRRLLDSLTPREFEIMTFVITGMLNKQIAGELGIAEDTVKIHRGRMMKKVGVESVAELVRLCEKTGVAPAIPSEG